MSIHSKPVGYRDVEADLTQDIITLVDRVIDRDRKISELQRGSDKLRHKTEEVQADLKKSEVKVTELRKRLIEFESKHKDQDKKIEHLRSENRRLKAEAEKQLDLAAGRSEALRLKYEESTSWKITAPIRAMFQLCRKR